MIDGCDRGLGNEIEADTAAVVTVAADKIWPCTHEEINNNAFGGKHPTQGGKFAICAAR